MKTKNVEEFVHEMEVRLHMLNYDGQHKLINRELFKWYHDIRNEALREAAVAAQAIGPCSGTKDWNDSRNCTIRHCADAILSLISTKETKG